MGTNVFKLNESGKYQIVDYIKSDEEIDKETFAKIKAKYPDEPVSGLPLEIKMLRKGIVNPQDADFAAYNNFVSKCRDEGATTKATNAAKLATLKQITLTEGTMNRIIYVVE